MRKFFGAVLAGIAALALTAGYFSWSVRDKVVTTELASEFFDDVLADPAARDELVDEAVEEILTDPDRRALIEALGAEPEPLVRSVVDTAYDTPEFRNELDSAAERALSDRGEGGELVFNARPAFDAAVTQALDPAQAAAIAELPESTFELRSDVDANGSLGWASIRSSLRSIFLVATVVGVMSLAVSTLLFRSAGLFRSSGPLFATTWIMVVLATVFYALSRAIGNELVASAQDDGLIEQILVGNIADRLGDVTRLFLIATVAAAAIQVAARLARNQLKRLNPGGTDGTAGSIADWSDSSNVAAAGATQTVEANWPKIID